MTTLRSLTTKEIKDLTSDLKHQKIEVASILKNKIKIGKFDKKDIAALKNAIGKLVNEKNIPRYLTESEIDFVLNDIPHVPSCIEEIRKFNREQIIEKLRFDLSTFKIHPEKSSLESLKKMIHDSFYQSLCEPGESVGSIGSMSVGQLLTQLNLDAFHTAGSSKSGASGLDYIKQLFNPNAKKQFTSYTIHFREKNLTKEEIFHSYSQKFKGISVKELVVSSQIYDEVPYEDLTWYKNYKTCYEIPPDLELSKKFYRLKINVYKCFMFNISIKEIADVIEKSTRVDIKRKSVYCFTSPTNLGIIDIYAEEEFIRKTVNDFATQGKTFKVCEKRYRGGSRETEIDDETVKQKTYLKSVLDLQKDLDGLSSIFLSVILESCFKDMIIAGVKGLDKIDIIEKKNH